MAMITDVSYALQAIRLSALRHTDDPLTPRIISVDPSFALNPYIDASGLSDIDRWPEIKRALDSPPPDYPSSYDSLRNARNERATRDRSHSRGGDDAPGREGGLKYTQTIIGAGRTGGMGMRVSGRRAVEGEGRGRNGPRANSSEALSPMKGKMPLASQQPRMVDDGFFSPSRRPRADSAPVPVLVVPSMTPSQLGSSMLASGLGSGGAGPPEQALSMSETSGDVEDEILGSMEQRFGEGFSSGIGGSTRRTDSETAGRDAGAGFGETMVDEGSDDEEADMEMAEEGDYYLDEAARIARDESRRSSMLDPEVTLSFATVPIVRQPSIRQSALTAALNKHIPHLVSTAHGLETEDELAPLAQPNPFASLYTTVAAPGTVASLTLELFFPHSEDPSVPIMAKVRKDATVEDVTGYALYKYWEEGRQPGLSQEEVEERWTTVGWGLRIVEDDGEVDEDFPPLDRDSKISKFSYGQFGIVEATASQIKQNAAKAPLIVRRPSRVIAQPTRPAQSRNPTKVPVTQRPPILQNASSSSSVRSFSSSENLAVPSMPGADGGTFKGSVGLSSALSKQVILRIRVTASADVHFTTTISVPSDIYIADLTEILCKKKRLAPPYTDWVLCLADLTLAIPVDRTVASLEGKNDLALVKTQWAVEHGLRIGDRRGGDPSASIFKRQSEPNPAARFGPGLADFAQTYKKYKVNRKIAIGRHERTLAIDGDYIHIMPSESRAFFDSMKTTSFHISLVAGVKLSGRSGGFKINVWRDGGQKRYEFEGENERQAIEIVGSIQGLMRGYLSERSSILPTPRTVMKR